MGTAACSTTGEVDNDRTLEIYQRIARAQAAAGPTWSGRAA